MVNKFGYLKKSILENIDNFKNNEIERDEELGWFKEHKKTIGWIIILIGIVVACAINLWS